MRRESKLLLEKACDALVLSIELFNRPHDRGRIAGTLIQLDHGFEMLMKAAIVQRGGRIRDTGAKQTIGFDACVRKSLTDGDIKYLTDAQAIVLQTINGLRDAAQHYLLDISEGQLYVHVQSGVTLFRDLLKNVFDEHLSSHLPKRVLPISTSLPTDLAILFDSEISEVKKLLSPGRRRGIEVLAKLRPLAILDGTIRGEKGQPEDRELRQIGAELAVGKNWVDVFEGVAAVEITTEGAGPSLSLRIAKKEGIPVHLVPEGTPGASVVAIKRVSELGFYNMGAKQLATHVGLTVPKLVAVIQELKLCTDPEYYKEITVGKAVHKRYSQSAIAAILEGLKCESIDEIWIRYKKTKSNRDMRTD